MQPSHVSMALRCNNNLELKNAIYALRKSKDELLLIGRVLLMILFVLFGWSKLTHYSDTVAYMTSTGAPAPALSAIVAIVMEFSSALQS